MEHVVMGTMLLIIALCMIVGAILTAPKLERMGVQHSARYSFAIVCVCTAAYLGWVATLFYRDVLGSENYALGLWVIRVTLMLACFHYLWSIWRCDR